MKSVIKKTFGGLSARYYVRQCLFGSIISALIVYMLTQTSGLTIGSWLMVVFSTLLYPYSRYVYESIVDFVMGDNVFFTNAVFMLSVKFITMAMCWSFAILIAPIGLVYLYYYHSKAHS